jgi:YjbE family integral membrane protein
MIASEMVRPAFWLAALQIMGINILLSGDNAVVIALACRDLPPKERFWGMVLGAGVAAVLLIVFTGIVATLLKLPFLKLAGGLALFWVAIKLVAPQAHDAEDSPEAIEDLWRAVRVVVVANIVMSLDNVIAVAAAAKGNYLLLGLGLAVSIPVVIAGSALFLAILERFPIVVWGGGALLGWIAGGLLPDDPIIAQYLSSTTMVEMGTDYNLFGNAGHLAWNFELDPIEMICGLLGAAIVVLAGLHLTKKAQRAGAGETGHGAGPMPTPRAVGAPE